MFLEFSFSPFFSAKILKNRYRRIFEIKERLFFLIIEERLFEMDERLIKIKERLFEKKRIPDTRMANILDFKCLAIEHFSNFALNKRRYR